MYVDKSKGQSADVESIVKSISSGYDSLQKGIMQFVGAGELQGQAYDSGKQFFSSVIAPLTESIKTLGELTEQACNDFVDKYQSEVDSKSLKESELMEDIDKVIFEGYSDQEEVRFQELFKETMDNLDKDVRRGTVQKKDSSGLI